MQFGTKSISNLVVAMILVATMFPLALGLLSNAGNFVMSSTFSGNSTVNTTTIITLSDIADPSIITLLTIVVPIIGVIAIITGFLAYQQFRK